MSKMNFDKIIKELNEAPNLYNLYKESLNIMSKDDLYKFANKLETSFSKFIFKHIKDNNLNEEQVIKYLDDGIDTGISFNDLNKLKQLNDTINILLNDVQNSIDNKIELIAKENKGIFSDVSK